MRELRPSALIDSGLFLVAFVTVAGGIALREEGSSRVGGRGKLARDVSTSLSEGDDAFDGRAPNWGEKT